MDGIAQDVEEGMADLARRAQHAQVIPVIEDLPAPVVDAIEPTSDAHGEALHAARQGAGAFGFADEVEVVGLNGVMDEPESEPIFTASKASPEGAVRLVTPHRRKTGSQPQGDMERLASTEHRPPDALDSLPPPGPPGVPPDPAVHARSRLQPELLPPPGPSPRSPRLPLSQTWYRALKLDI